MCYILFIHLFVNRHLGCCCLLAVVNSVAVKMGDRCLFETLQFFLPILHPRNGIAGSYGDFMFNSLRRYHVILHSHQQHTNVSTSPYPHQHRSFLLLKI